MGNLPYERVNMAPPFSITALDLGGPYFVTYKHQRKGVLNKIYVCVCICFVTRAIHLEILSDLISDAIIATLKRFMSRRGKCSKIFTDNATNFVGANSQLKVFYKTLNFPDQNLAAYFTEEGIEWNFIPPRAPHMGGLWEAGIKSVKYHLKRALGRSRLTYEEFETVIIQVEGILNSRPLTPISNDFDNFEVLTPAHFLIGRSINSILEPLVINISDNRLSRWQRTTKVIQVVWKKWSTDYLNTLQQRGKWMIEKDNVMCGTMVIVKADFTPVCNWLLGRVVEVYHGSDGKSCINILVWFPETKTHRDHFPNNAQITVLPKPKKDSKFAENYRPISLLSCLGKIFEKIILTRIIDHCDRNNLIPDFQHGFRKETSTQHQLLRVTNNIINGFNTKSYTVGIFLDVKKAFDRMWHDGLIYKLIKLKFPTYLVKIVHNYLDNRTFNVKINSTSSSIRNIAAGTPQGSILSPALYNIYTSDFPTTPSVSVCLFADDAAILCNSITADQAVRTLQAYLSQLEIWLTKWIISINTEKTNAILFRKRRTQTMPIQLKLFDETIDWTYETSYLGLILNHNLTYRPHFNEIKKKKKNTGPNISPSSNCLERNQNCR
ncbi:RNA-directed DNA polymerase from mobile element jockey [Trichonephila clavipes]|nr:RNA-directed DNA polymerase from mobile element jockey [Trichonephila clavipes]